MSATIVRRTTARVVPVGARGEALLMLSCDPAQHEVAGFVRAAAAPIGRLP